MNRRFAILLMSVCFALSAHAVCAQSQFTEVGDNSRVAPSATDHVRIAKTTTEFATVVEQVDDFVKKYGTRNVLLVVDLDNTLLAMNQDLGSDQWFTWQETLLEKDRNHPGLVADDFVELLEIQGKLFSLSAMHPPEPGLPAMMDELTNQRITVLILTSRGKEYRDAAERELKRNDYDISQSTFDIREKRGVFKPYSKEHANEHGLNAQVIDRLGSPRSVTYSNGIYMTAGQHKGYMLKTLLARGKDSSRENRFAQFKAIVFVDDRLKHTERMHEAFADEPIDLATFRYSREDDNVEKFNHSTKRHVMRDWEQLNHVIESVMGK